MTTARPTVGLLALLALTWPGLAFGGDAKWAPAVEPKPLSNQVRRALGWLVSVQSESGGFAQGEVAQTRRGNENQTYGQANAADTCAAALALLRSGSTPARGEHAKAIRSAIAFICDKVEGADASSMWVADLRGTRLQTKLGQYIDTFLSALVLAEVKDRMPDQTSRRRVIAALDRIMDKIEKNQRPDGTWSDAGWAAALEQALASKAINRLAQSGYKASDQMRERAESYARKNFDDKSGKFADRGSASVALDAGASNLGAVQGSVNTNAVERSTLTVAATSAASPQVRQEAAMKLNRFDQVEIDMKAQKRAIVQKLADKKFLAGFGSNGGEEFLSYMQIGEALVEDGGDDWKKWDRSITENLNRIQNGDGSGTGHHCIIGKTFCTSAALLTLMVDRAPIPLAAQLKRR